MLLLTTSAMLITVFIGGAMLTQSGEEIDA